jgi:hypothetical protein
MKFWSRRQCRATLIQWRSNRPRGASAEVVTSVVTTSNATCGRKVMERRRLRRDERRTRSKNFVYSTTFGARSGCFSHVFLNSSRACVVPYLL